MNFSILSDFSDDDLDRMMNLGVQYSGEGSFADPENITLPFWSRDYIVGRDLLVGTDKYCTSNSNSTSWASALILAAEAALKKEGYDEKFSFHYVAKCLPESQEVDFQDVSPSDMIEFITEKGLMSETVASLLSEDELCSVTTPKFYFDVLRNDIPNKSGLMNFVAEGDPVIVLMALDLIRLKTVNDVTGDAIYTGATDQPSLYGVMKGYDEKKWTVMFNVVPCENIEMNLPVVDNDTNANYAGIAGYAFSLKSKPISTEFVVDNSVISLDVIPSWVTKIIIKQGSLNTVSELIFDFPKLTTLIIEDNSCMNVHYIEINSPYLEELTIGDNAFSGLLKTRRLADQVGKFVLNTPMLKILKIKQRSLWNIHSLVLIQINSDIKLELIEYGLNSIRKIQYRVDLPFDMVMSIKVKMESNVGHEGSIVLEPLDLPTTVPPTTATPTEAPTQLACEEGFSHYSIKRYYGLNPNSSEIMTLFSGYDDYEIVSMSYQGNSVDIFEGCVQPQLMRIELEGWSDGWNEDSYVEIQSEFGIKEKITLSESFSQNIFINISTGIIPETRITTCGEFNNLDNSPKILHIEANACNDDSVVSFVTERFKDLILLWIEDNNFMNVSTFDIRNHAHLSHILIEGNSFTQHYNYYGNDTTKSFHIMNCTSLISLKIGPFSFSDYAGAFVLRNLPVLRTLLIGAVNKTSYNFYYSSFEIIGKCKQRE